MKKKEYLVPTVNSVVITIAANLMAGSVTETGLDDFNGYNGESDEDDEAD